MPEQESTNRHPDRVHERPSDPADAANRPLEPRSSGEALHETDTPHPGDANPHHRLNTPVGEVDPAADSDPYRSETPEDDGDTASGTTGVGEDEDSRR